MIKKIFIVFLFLVYISPVFALEDGEKLSAAAETIQENPENIDINNKLKKELKEAIDKEEVDIYFDYYNYNSNKKQFELDKSINAPYCFPKVIKY